jgi:hypothetical protein
VPIVKRDHLRPVERRILAMRDEGVPVDEIGRRIRRSPQHVARMIAWTEFPRHRPPSRNAVWAIHNRVLAMRAAGETHEEIGLRFRRSPRSIRQIEGLAHYRIGLQLLG